MESVTMTLFLILVAVVLGGSSIKFKLTSSAFENGKPIPTKYASAYISGGRMFLFRFHGVARRTARNLSLLRLSTFIRSRTIGFTGRS